jgi:small subunit ribosomal protein S9
LLQTNSIIKFTSSNKNSLIKSAFGTGRRKCAIAKVQITLKAPDQINPIFLINQQPANVYLQENSSTILSIKGSLDLLTLQKNFDIYVSVIGGGLIGQADAIKLGLARALCNMDSSSRSLLKSQGYLTRDARCKERRKYGLKKARKAPQYSKR